MFTKTKVALSIAIVLGAASAALANEPVDADGGGFRVQNWQAILQADRATDAYHAYGFASPNHKRGFVVASPKQTRPLSREND
jgi:hypothetical protein